MCLKGKNNPNLQYQSLICKWIADIPFDHLVYNNK